MSGPSLVVCISYLHYMTPWWDVSSVLSCSCFPRPAPSSEAPFRLLPFCFFGAWPPPRSRTTPRRQHMNTHGPSPTRSIRQRLAPPAACPQSATPPTTPPRASDAGLPSVARGRKEGVATMAGWRPRARPSLAPVPASSHSPRAAFPFPLPRRASPRPPCLPHSEHVRKEAEGDR